MSTLNAKVAEMQLEQMPLVVVQYHGLQQGFAQLAPQALFNVVGGEVADLLGSTVVLSSLYAKGYRIEEVKNGQRSTLNVQLSQEVA
jgi:hypothetical protein